MGGKVSVIFAAEQIVGRDHEASRDASFFSGVRIRLGMIFNYLILWVRVKGQG